MCNLKNHHQDQFSHLFVVKIPSASVKSDPMAAPMLGFRSRCRSFVTLVFFYGVPVRLLTSVPEAAHSWKAPRL